MSKTKLILTHARNLVDNGWIKGDFRNSDKTCFCAYGAIIEALRVNYDPEEYYDSEMNLVCRALVKVIRYPCIMNVQSMITEYNDESDTTKEDVLAMFDLAIESVEEECNV
jgi:hypothetical protein